MRKINIYLVESPFQLLSAIEAKEHFKYSDSLLVIKYISDLENNEQMNKMLSLTKWDKIIRIAYQLPTIVDFKFLYVIARLKKSKQKIDNIFVGYPPSRNFQWFCENLTANKCFTLDDGVYTIELQKKYFSQGNYLQKSDVLNMNRKINILMRIKNIIKNIIIKNIFGLKNDKKIFYNLFTCFELEVNPDQTIILHKFDYLKSKISILKYQKNVVYFYGSPLSESGIVEFYIEMNMLKNIKIFYSKLEKKLFYLPHRRDSIEKIAYIENSGIQIKKSTYTAEVEPIIDKTLPSDIASFFSTTLYTLERIYNYDSIISFRIPETLIVREDKKDVILELYEEYEKHMKVVSLT